MKYYEIDERAAKAAKDANSYFDYVPGSATAEYRRMVDRAAELAEAEKAKVDSSYHEKIDYYLDLYARKLAENMNHRYAIDARVPSILVAGGSNFPVAKKNKQNAARDSNDAEYAQIQGILNKIRSIGKGGIMSDDEHAIEKLQAKLHGLEAEQDHMKKVNAYYRKNKTLDGCPDLDSVSRAKLESSMSRSIHDTPYPGWALSNNNANIHRVRDRIAQLEKEAERAAENADTPGAGEVKGDGYVLVENAELCRIQFIFDGKPDDETRAYLKSHGFRWSPSQGAWQRMLNDNGRYAAKQACEWLAQGSAAQA